MLFRSTNDPRQIQRYLAFRDTLKMMREMDLERERQPVPKQPSGSYSAPGDKKKRTAHER